MNSNGKKTRFTSLLLLLSDSASGSRWYQYLFSLALTIGVGFLIFWKLDVASMIALLKTVQWHILLVMLLLSLCVNVLIASHKYLLVVRALDCKLPLRIAVFLRLGTMPLKFLIPGKIGEFTKALYLKSQLQLPLSQGLSTVIYDKASNGFGILLLILLGRSFGNPVKIPNVIILLIAASVISFFLLSQVVRKLAPLLHNHKKIQEIVVRLFSPFIIFSFPQNAFFLLYGAFFEFAEVVNTFLAFYALGAPVPFKAVLITAPLMIFLANIPITISGIGIREVSLALILASYGNPEILVTAGFLVSVVDYIIPAILGLPLLSHFIRKSIPPVYDTIEQGT